MSQLLVSNSLKGIDMPLNQLNQTKPIHWFELSCIVSSNPIKHNFQ